MGRNKVKSTAKRLARSESEKRKPSSSPVDSVPSKSTKQDLVQKTLDFKTMAENFCANFNPGKNVTSTPKDSNKDSDKTATEGNVSGTPSYLDQSVFNFINTAAQDALTSKLSTALMLPQLQEKFQTAFMEVATTLITEHVQTIVKPLKESIVQLKSEMEPMKEDIKELKLLKDELVPLKEEVKSLRKMLEEKVNDIGECKEEIEELREEVESKTEKIKKQKTDIRIIRRHFEEKTDDLEQYSRRNSIRITGVPESPYEDIEKVVMDVLTTVDETLPITAIDRCHRVGHRAQGRTRQIIVKFMNYHYKYRMIKNRRRLAQKYKNIYINEDLTKARSLLFKTSRDMLKNKCFSGTWTRDGRIFIEEQPEGMIREIKSDYDLDRYRK